MMMSAQDTTVTTLTKQVTNKLGALKQLKSKIDDMKVYLDQVVAGQLAPNPQILYHMQNIFNLVPNLRVEVRLESS
jgi:26S proteasome regulatory subunit N8